MGIIYYLYFSNGKGYVGKTFDKTPKRRLVSHRKSKFLIGNAIRKHKEFTTYILFECDTDEDLDKVEKYYIAKLNTKTPKGYNITDGGEGMSGFRHSEESKIAMRNTHLRLEKLGLMKHARQASREAVKSPIHREKCSERFKTWWKIAENREAIVPKLIKMLSIRNKNPLFIESNRIKLSRSKKINWENGEHRERNRKLIIEGLRKKLKDPEYKLKKSLCSRETIQKLNADSEFQKKASEGHKRSLRERRKDPEYEKNYLIRMKSMSLAAAKKKIGDKNGHNNTTTGHST